jgi:long-chain acyl-CoA synthetase
MTSYLTGIMPLRQVHKPPFTIEAPGYEPVEGETLPRRHPRAKDGLLTQPAEDVHNVVDIVTRSARLHPDEPAIGSRKLVQMHKEVKKVHKVIDGEVQQVDKEWQYFELTPYSFLTFKEYETLITQVGAGLRKLGLGKGSKLHMFATTR